MTPITAVLLASAHLATIWYAVVGAIAVVVSLSASFIRRMPLTTAIAYLAIGWAIGPDGLSLVSLNPVTHSLIIERVAEVVIIISLFAAGLSLRAMWFDQKWKAALRLAFGSMALTAGLICLTGVYLMHLSWGAALLLGGMLAPTDPVLASDVELQHPYDPSPLRFSLTGEAGLNDGATFPFIMLGLGLLGLSPGNTGWRWLGVDVFWGVLGGLLIGWFLGVGVTHLALHMRRQHGQALGLGFFLAPGLIALAYGAALATHTYGFLAVFAAGLGVRHVELREVGPQPPEELMELAVSPSQRSELATDAKKAPVYLVQGLLNFSEQLMHIGEAVIVIMVGAMLSARDFSLTLLWFLPLLFLVIRPLSVGLGLLGSFISLPERALISWFGIRGIATIYYMAYFINHGVSGQFTRGLAGLAIAVVTVSILTHGGSVTPLMNYYERHHQRKHEHSEEEQKAA